MPPQDEWAQRHEGSDLRSLLRVGSQWCLWIVDREVEMNFKDKPENIQLSALCRALFSTPAKERESTSQPNNFLYRALLAVKPDPPRAPGSGVLKALFEGTYTVPASLPGF